MAAVDTQTLKKQKKELKKMIKGYKGYDKPKDRVDTNNAFVKYLQDKLTDALDLVREIQEAAIMSQMITIWSDLDGIVQNLKQAKITLEKTDYGISTFFDVPKLVEFDLSLLYRIEFDILSKIAQLKEKIIAFNDAMESGLLSDSTAKAEEIQEDLNNFISLWKERASLIRNYQKLNLTE